MKTILVTGASGYIGQAISKILSMKYRIIALDRVSGFWDQENIISITADIEDENELNNVCKTYIPDVIIHCAGLAHQKLFGKKRTDLYEGINSIATEKLAYAAISANPAVHFVFLSSISVYGESHSKEKIRETHKCFPTSPYAESKRSAEKRLKALYTSNQLKKLDVLRLAPVYDSKWSRNLEKRVFPPLKMVYLRFGSGEQKMSALARMNLVEFIEFKLENENKTQFHNVTNVCDEHSYSFNTIIQTFQKTEIHPKRKVIPIPLRFVEVLIHIAARLLKNKHIWIHSFYNKLSKDLVFDNTRMLDTGFKPMQDLNSVFIH